MKETLEQMRSRLAEIEAKIYPLSEEAGKLRRDILLEQSQFKIGDIIQWHSGRTGQERTGRVVDVRHWVGDDVYWIVSRTLKSGVEGQPIEVRPYDRPTLVKKSECT